MYSLILHISQNHCHNGVQTVDNFQILNHDNLVCITVENMKEGWE